MKLHRHKHRYRKGDERGTMGYHCAKCGEWVWDSGPYVGPPIKHINIEAEMRSMGRTMNDYQPKQ